MQQISGCLYASITFIAALAQANCTAQELQSKFKLRVVYERDVEQAPTGLPPRFSHLFDSRKRAGGIATLNRLGTQLLLNDPANSQLIIVDTKNLAESTIPLTSPAVQVQIESQTEMLFVGTYTTNAQYDALHTCYDDLTALRNRQPRWSLQGPGLAGLQHFTQIRWLNEHKQFIAFDRQMKPTLVLLDHQGIQLAEHELQGWIQGIDETEKGFNIFYLESERGAHQLALTQLDNNFKLRKNQRLPLIDRPQSPGSIQPLGISESFRLRGLKSSEVTRYFLEIASQPGYLEMRGRLPFDNLTSRFLYTNKLSAAESSSQPEIIVGVIRGGNIKSIDGFMLFDQQSNYYYEPDQWLTDAIFDDERSLVVSVADSKKPGHWKVRLISF